MNKFGRSAWIGLGVGTTAGIGLVLFIIYKEMKRRISQRLSIQNNSDTFCTDGPSAAIADSQVPMAQGSLPGAPAGGAGRDLTPELRNGLEDVLRSVADLRSEVASLQSSLQGIAARIVQDVRSGIEESQKAARRRRHHLPRERTDSMSSSSIYFTASTASAGSTHPYDGESEGGYITANAESDYNGEVDTDKETDEEDRSCPTSCTLRQDSSDVGGEEDEFLDTKVPGVTPVQLSSQSKGERPAPAREKAAGIEPLQLNRALCHKEAGSIPEAEHGANPALETLGVCTEGVDGTSWEDAQTDQQDSVSSGTQ
ncbi:regulator of microtubule dynamics protein 3-like isoform X2 [Megalops cyprinoides]|uniref:regulator of microtubule dynamics protein 3-like isoform X2 n=1 Tax=Megalops cyprinoides TaxID=118141 RepID=UPI0018654EAB|nr:regulator of microtubule dynamics protein 3-like isoform X2 [Megalops cyprinoides]